MEGSVACLGEAAGAVVELLNHGGGGALLGCEHMGGSVGATEGVGDVGGEGELAMGSYVAPLVVEGAEHACAAVGGGAAAETYDETAGTVAVGMEHLFAYAP